MQDDKLLKQLDFAYQRGINEGIEKLRLELSHHEGDIPLALRCLSAQLGTSIVNVPCTGCVHCAGAGKIMRGPSRVGVGEL